MQIINADLLKELRGSLKFLLTETGVVFFPASQQHRDMKATGLSYEDEYLGNAMAGLVMPGRVEIRFHKAFPDARVAALWTRVLASPELAQAALGPLYYQGREIS